MTADCKLVPFFFEGMADCCKWLREQGLDLGATNNQGEEFFQKNLKAERYLNFHQVTMPCTRQHMVVMQHCVLGCRSGPPGVSSGFNFWKNAWKIRHVFCDLVCQDYAALDPDQEDVRYGFFSQVKSLDHGFFGFGKPLVGKFETLIAEGANLCSLGREGWFSGWEQTFNAFWPGKNCF